MDTLSDLPGFKGLPKATRIAIKRTMKAGVKSGLELEKLKAGEDSGARASLPDDGGTICPEIDRMSYNARARFASRLADEIKRAAFSNKTHRGYDGEAKHWNAWFTAFSRVMKRASMGDVIRVGTALGEADQMARYCANKDAFLHSKVRNLSGEILRLTLSAEAANRLDALPTGSTHDGDADDGALYLAHLYERCGAARLLTVESAFDSIVEMIQDAMTGKSKDKSPTAILNRFDRVFDSQFSGPLAMKWLKVMMMCAVVDRSKYGTMLRDLDQKRIKEKVTGPPTEHEIRASCETIWDRDLHDTQSKLMPRSSTGELENSGKLARLRKRLKKAESDLATMG
jgi:hypothetical protein